MNRKTFFGALRRRGSGVFGTSLSQGQVDVMNAIIDQSESAGLPVAHVSYILATAYHEPGPKSRMKPNRENLYYTTARRIKKVWPSRFSLDSASRYIRNPQKLANKVYNGRLGNRTGSQDGWNYRGGGIDHLTGRDNYRRLSPIVGVDLVAEPERILEPKIAVESLMHGMTTGRYRKHKLSDFLHTGRKDYINARSIVNADVGLYGNTVAGYARSFENALIEGGYSQALTPPPPDVVIASDKPRRGLWARLFGGRS